MYSAKQLALKDYLIQRLGFTNPEFLDKYISALGQSSQYHRNFGAKYPDGDKEINDMYYYFDGEKWLPIKYTLIDYLIDEYELKKNKKAKLAEKKEIENRLVSATDLSSYSFCPVSYSISKSFVVETGASAERGTSLHEDCRLINRANFKSTRIEESEYEYDYETTRLINNGNKELFEDIKKSRLIYSGHSEVEKRYFINNLGNFVGQPDYVFEKSNGKRFIVEEKFKLDKWDSKPNFYHNHQIQLYSYIYGLDHFAVDYGYLVYWYYDFNSGYYNVINCKILRLEKSDKARYYLNNVYVSLKNFKESKNIDFNSDLLNPKKCANCAVGQYCGHKTGHFDKLKYPYTHEYHKIWFAAYPDILKKETCTDLSEPRSNLVHFDNQEGKVKANSIQSASFTNLTPNEEKEI